MLVYLFLNTTNKLTIQLTNKMSNKSNKSINNKKTINLIQTVLSPYFYFTLELYKGYGTNKDLLPEIEDLTCLDFKQTDNNDNNKNINEDQLLNEIKALGLNLGSVNIYSVKNKGRFISINLNKCAKKIYVIYHSILQASNVFTSDGTKVLDIIEKMKQKYSDVNDGEWNYRVLVEEELFEGSLIVS